MISANEGSLLKYSLMIATQAYQIILLPELTMKFALRFQVIKVSFLQVGKKNNKTPVSTQPKVVVFRSTVLNKRHMRYSIFRKFTWLFLVDFPTLRYCRFITYFRVEESPWTA
jgi:hypothetical protein